MSILIVVLLTFPRAFYTFITPAVTGFSDGGLHSTTQLKIQKPILKKNYHLFTQTNPHTSNIKPAPRRHLKQK
ncbi:hypothetical protein, partial [Enterobacter intestinihominis]